jgi:hypothetical protein
MNTEISQNTLIDFIEIAKKYNFDFARCTYDCHAEMFIEQPTRDFDRAARKYIKTYKFKEHFLKQENFASYPYYVLSISEKSYLMFELHKEIMIWVCYTEENHRRNGYMFNLLKEVKVRYTTKKITIDTADKSLRRSCLNIGINLLK